MIARSQSCHNPRCLSACPACPLVQLVQGLSALVRSRFGTLAVEAFWAAEDCLLRLPTPKGGGFFGARAAAARRLCEPETQLEPEPLRSDLLNLDLGLCTRIR